jgi:hypothetical protein
MRAALSLTLVLGACVQPVPQGAGQGGVAPKVSEPLRVTNGGQPFRQYEGAAPRRVAEATCAAQGRRLRPSIYDRFEGGTWVYVGGCA